LWAATAITRKSLGVQAAHALTSSFSHIKTVQDIPARERSAVRNDLNRVLTELRVVSESKAIAESKKRSAKSIHDNLMKSVQYAPWWVRVLSALCLGLGTMIGYKRIVKTLGER
jgi:PiT family inorganic phosphate transporter